MKKRFTFTLQIKQLTKVEQLTKGNLALVSQCFGIWIIPYKSPGTKSHTKRCEMKSWSAERKAADNFLAFSRKPQWSDSLTNRNWHFLLSVELDPHTRIFRFLDLNVFQFSIRIFALDDVQRRPEFFGVRWVEASKFWSENKRSPQGNAWDWLNILNKEFYWIFWFDFGIDLTFMWIEDCWTLKKH